MILIADGGRGSLKLVLLLRYSDDPLLQDDITPEDIKRWQNSAAHKDGGVNRTFILGEIPGVGESTYTVHFLHNSLDLKALVDFCKKHGIELILPNDMKMANHLLNIGTHSSTHPLVWSLWSQLLSKDGGNLDDVERTIQECIKLADERETDRKSGKEKPDKEYFNVKGFPVDVLKYFFDVFPSKTLLDVLPGGPLHYLLVVNTFLDWLDRLLPGFVQSSVEAPISEGGLGLKPSNNRGRSSQPGNHCKEILENAEHFRACLPSNEDVRALRERARGTSDERVIVNSCDRFEAALKLTTEVFVEFNSAHSSVSKPPTNSVDLQAFPRLWKAVNEYVPLHRAVEPGETGRKLVTPKLYSFLTFVPERCRKTGVNYYHANEQAGEAIHVKAQDIRATMLPRIEAWLEDMSKSSSKKRRRSRPSDGTRSGAQAQMQKDEEKKVELSERQRAVMNTMYQKSSKKWSIAPAIDTTDETPKKKSVSRPSLKAPCPPGKVVKHAGNTETSERVYLWSLEVLTRNSFPLSTYRDRLEVAVEFAQGKHDEAPPWEQHQWENVKK